MTTVAYLIRTLHGSGQYPERVDRLTFDPEAAKRACEMGATVEALVTISEAHAQRAAKS